MILQHIDIALASLTHMRPPAASPHPSACRSGLSGSLARSAVIRNSLRLTGGGSLRTVAGMHVRGALPGRSGVPCSHLNTESIDRSAALVNHVGQT